MGVTGADSPGLRQPCRSANSTKPPNESCSQVNADSRQLSVPYVKVKLPMDNRELLPTVIFHDKAGIQFLDGPRRPEAAY